MTAKKSLTARERLDDSMTMRMDAVVDIASQIGSDNFEGPSRRLHGAVEELIEYLLDTDYKVHPSMEYLRKVVSKAAGDEDEMEFVAEALVRHNLLGLAVQFVTPVMTKTSKTSHSFTWGYTQSTWVYADSYDEAWKLGVAWAEKCRKEAKPAPKKASKAETEDLDG